MRVVINQWMPLGSKSGIGHYTDQLLHHLRGEAVPDEIDSFPANWLRRGRDMGGRIQSLLARRDDSTAASRAPPSFWTRIRRAAVRGLRQTSRRILGEHLRSLHWRRGYDLYHEPNFIPLPIDCPTLTTLHDLSVLLHPEWHPADRVAWFEQRLPEVLRRCVHFLTISEFSRREVMHRLGVPPERVTRVYLGIRAGLARLPERQVASTLKQLGLPPRYLLHVGTIEPRKNLLMLMQAYCALPEPVRSQWPLVLAGSWGWNTAATRDFYHTEARHRGVIHAGYVPDEHLGAVYNGARALLCPSWYEGFGLPPLEMLACGGAVLASTAAALVEILGDKAHLIKPADMEGWRDAMARVLTDDDWWLALRRGATEHAAPFTWQRCAAETLTVYRRLCGIQEQAA